MIEIPEQRSGGNENRFSPILELNLGSDIPAGGRQVNVDTFADVHPRLARIISFCAGAIAFFVAIPLTPVFGLLTLIPAIYKGYKSDPDDSHRYDGLKFALASIGLAPLTGLVAGGLLANDVYNIVLGRLGDLDARRNANYTMIDTCRELLSFRTDDENDDRWVARHRAERSDRQSVELYREEQQRIRKELKESKPLVQNVTQWCNNLEKSDRTEIDVQKWESLGKDTTQQSWTVPLSATLQKLHEGAKKDPVTKKIDAAFATRMKNVLKVIQSNHKPFIPYLSTLGEDTLGQCNDRPVTVFLDLELRTQAYQTLTDIRDGKKTRQDMLDVAVKRLVFDETLDQLNISVPVCHSVDPVEARLHLWESIQKQNLLDIPALPYRLFGANLSNQQIADVTTSIVDVVKRRYRDRNVINEFLARNDSPVPWKEDGGPSLSNETRIKIEILRKQKEELSVPEQGDQNWDSYANSAPYAQYLAHCQEIIEQCNQLESENIYFDQTQDKWLVK